MRNLVCILILILLASCTKREATLSPEEAARRDSTALRVAVMPTWSCLPLYYAESTGLLTDSDTNIRLLRYTAQMDIDTTLARGHAEVGYSDLIRLLRLQREARLQALLSMDEPVALVAVKGRRVSKVHQLKEKTVAMSRLCITDYWCDRMLEPADDEAETFYRPQVHNVRLRTDMLRTGLIDAAILPEPYATWMDMTGNKVLRRTTDKDPQLAILTVRSEAATKTHTEQTMRLVEIYRKAAQQIANGEAPQTLRTILMREYGLPAEAADSLALHPIPTLCRPTATADFAPATKFLTDRQRLPKGLVTDSLIYSVATK